MEPQKNPSERSQREWIPLWGEKERKEPVSTNVTERYRGGGGRERVRQLNFKLGNGNYEQNNQTNTNKRIKA